MVLGRTGFFLCRVATLQLHAVDEGKPQGRFIAAGVHSAGVDLIAQTLGRTVLTAEHVSVGFGVETLFGVAVRVKSQFDVGPKLGS